MPRYLLRHLTTHLPALQAEEQRALITAGLSPWMEDWARRNLLHSLEQRTASLRPAQPAHEVEFIEYDPEKAKAYFESLGIRVQTAHD